MFLYLIFGFQFMGCKNCQENQIITQEKINEPEADPEPEPFSNKWGAWLSMAVTPEGNPAVSYYDKTTGGLGYAVADMSSGSAVWTHEEVDGYTNEQGLDEGDRGKFTSLAIASDGQVWISYYDVGLKYLRFATKDPSTGEWKFAMADMGGGASPNAGLFTSIALDGSEAPVITHYDIAKGNLRIAHWNGSQFDGEIVDQGEDSVSETGEVVAPANVGQFSSLAIVNDTEFIAYYDGANGDLMLATGTSGSYTVERLDTEGDVGQWPDIVVENDQVHIAYHNVSEQNLKYISGAPGNWTITTVDDSAVVGADTALSLSGGYPTIVYHDGENNDMKIARLTGDEWMIETVTGSNGPLGFHNEIININGRHYAACYNFQEHTVWFDTVD